jgi:hypothetical protein
MYGVNKNGYRVSVGKPERNSNWEDLNVDGRIILNWILGK